MPREDRRVIFDFSETYNALYALSVKQGMKKPPAGRIAALIEDPEDSRTIIVTLRNDQESTSREISFSRDFFAASLMLACRGTAIPIPKRGRKSVMFGADSVTLRILIDP